MKISIFIPVVLIPGFTLAYNFFKPTQGAVTDSENSKPYSGCSTTIQEFDIQTDQKIVTELPSNFNPTELLDSSHKPEVYTKAMIELQRLEQEPVCHRLAAQLLINNCKGVDETSNQDPSSSSAHLQRHHIESFACALSMCDLERAKFVIPEACIPFGSASLYQVSRNKHSRLDISSEEVGGCLEALAQDYSLWSTWLSYRDKSLLFCRASRLDIDKGIQ
jgi:hypothetical protein